MKLIAAGIYALCAMVAGEGCGDDGAETAGGDAGHDGGDGLPGCAGAPGSAYDPLASYVAPPRTVTLVVTSVADAGPGSLRAALASAPADAVIGFAPALAQQSIALESKLELANSVTIDGSGAPGITLDGQNKTAMLHYSGDAKHAFVFASLRFRRGMHAASETFKSGAAIDLNGKLLDVEVAGCRFEDNVSSEGGAIRVGYLKETNVYVHDSVFERNSGADGGGGTGHSGGAISAQNTNLHVARCRFDANAGPVTGALYTIGSDPLVEDTVFVGNRTTALTSGSGAFFADGANGGTSASAPAGVMTLRRVLFEGNHGAGDDSGAVEAYAYPNDTVVIDACVFHANHAEGRAGAAFIHANKQVDVMRTAFVDNDATGQGGAIWADGDASYTFENVLFSGNSTTSDFGGALRLNITNAARLRIASTTVVDNLASGGNGAIWIAGMRDAHVTNSIFANNRTVGSGQQINFPMTDDGGNIVWPMVSTATPALASALAADPLLGPLLATDGTWARMPEPASPAVGGGVAPAPMIDLRGAARDTAPDIGAFEVGARCN
ncbi:hypothetical protein BH11MYX1_BH11MYX1_20210 [soil metagenome]